MTAIVEDVQSQGIDSSIIILYDLEYTDGSFAYFFSDGLDSDLTQVQFRDSSGVAKTYTAIPIEAENFEISSDGAMNRPKLTVANLHNTFSSAIGGLDFEDLIGQRITRRTTLKKYLVGETGDTGNGNAPVEFPKTTYVIDRISSKNVLQVEFELAAPFDLAGVQLPRRVIVGGSCPWRYTGAGSKKYVSNAYTSRPEKEKIGGCNWRADSKITVNGTEYTLYMSPEDEYILPSGTVSFTNGNSLSSFTAGTYYSTTASNLQEITGPGILAAASGVNNYWQCLANTSTAPSDASSSWRRVWVYLHGSAVPSQSGDSSITVKGYKDKRYNTYFVKNSFLWKVKRNTQTLAHDTALQEGDLWTQGDVCGKTLTSCAMRFQAVPDGNGGFTRARDSRIALPYGGYPGVVQRR